MSKQTILKIILKSFATIFVVLMMVILVTGGDWQMLLDIITRGDKPIYFLGKIAVVLTIVPALALVELIETAFTKE